MNRQQRLLSRAAVRVIYQVGIIEARGDEWSAWPLAPPDNGPTRPPHPGTRRYLVCFFSPATGTVAPSEKGYQSFRTAGLKGPQFMQNLLCLHFLQNNCVF